MLDRSSIEGAGQTPPPAPRLAGMLRVLHRPEFVVAVVGSTSAGKSTACNALICRNLLPSDDLPSNACVVTIGHGDEKLEIHWPAGIEQRPLAQGFADATLCDATGLRREGPAAERIGVLLPTIPPGSLIADCPGFCDTPALAQLAMDDALRADAVLLVLDPRRLVPEEVADFVLALQAARPGLPIAAALNLRLATHDNIGWLEAQPAAERFRRFLDQRLPGVPMIACSARAGLEGLPIAMEAVHGWLNTARDALPSVRAALRDAMLARVVDSTERLRARNASRFARAEAHAAAQECVRTEVRVELQRFAKWRVPPIAKRIGEDVRTGPLNSATAIDRAINDALSAKSAGQPLTRFIERQRTDLGLSPLRQSELGRLEILFKPRSADVSLVMREPLHRGVLESIAVELFGRQAGWSPPTPDWDATALAAEREVKGIARREVASTDYYQDRAVEIGLGPPPNTEPAHRRAWQLDRRLGLVHRLLIYPDVPRSTPKPNALQTPALITRRPRTTR